MTEFFATYWSSVSGVLLTTLLIMIADLVLGAFLALKNRNFRWSKLSDFLIKGVPMIFGILLATALEFAPLEDIGPLLGPLAGLTKEAIFGLVAARYVGGIIENGIALGVIPTRLQSAGFGKPEG